jgi:hypothetical protein
MRTVLRLPGVLPALAASCLAQLPVGALGLLLVLQTRDATGSYAAGGAVAAAYALAVGLSNPLLGRIADRRGQVRMLEAGGVAAAAALVGEAVLRDGAPVIARVALAVVAGAAQPPIGAFRRRLWHVLVPDDDLRHRWYAAEGVVLEVVYVVGPVVIVAGIGTWSLVGALLACAAAIVAGDLLFARQAAVRAIEGDAREGRDLAGALRSRGVLVAVALIATLGVSLGAAEVGVPAALEHMGNRSLTGVVLGLWGAGSMLGGLAMSRLGVPARKELWLALLAATWGVLHGLVALTGTPALLAVAITVAGASIAPTLTVLNGLLDRVALPGTITEAVTWISCGMTAGMAAGGALAGTLAEAVSPAAALGLGAAGLAGAALVAAFRPVLARPAVAV